MFATRCALHVVPRMPLTELKSPIALQLGKNTCVDIWWSSCSQHRTNTHRGMHTPSPQYTRTNMHGSRNTQPTHSGAKPAPRRSQPPTPCSATPSNQPDTQAHMILRVHSISHTHTLHDVGGRKQAHNVALQDNRQQQTHTRSTRTTPCTRAVNCRCHTSQASTSHDRCEQ